MRRAAEAVGASLNAATVTIDRMIKRNIGAVIVANDRTRLSLFVNLDLHSRRFTNPFDRMREPGIRRVRNVAHVVLPMQQHLSTALRPRQAKRKAEQSCSALSSPA